MSLSENLHNLGTLLKTNLETKGINGLTGNEGLTTLANKILDISSGSCDSLTLIGLPQIIQKDETSHIGAKLIVSGSPVVNETIYFNIKPPEKYCANYNSFSQLFTENSLGGRGYKSKDKIIQFTASGDTEISFISETASNPYLTETLGKGEYIITFYDSPFQLFEVINGEAVYIKGISAPSGDVWFDFEKNSSNDNVTNIRVRERITITSAKTDKDGIATIPYVGTGKGMMTVEANYYKYGGIFLQETYELLDALFYDKGLDGTGNYNDAIWKLGNATLTRGADGSTVNVTANWGSISLGTTSTVANVDVTNGICMEFDLIEKTENANFQWRRSSDNGYDAMPQALGHHKHIVYNDKLLFTVDGEIKYGGWVTKNLGDTIQISGYCADSTKSFKFANFKVYPTDTPRPIDAIF